MAQLCIIAALEASRSTEPSGILSSEVAFPVFACLVALEIFCVITLAMYRISPWILHFLRDDFEAARIQDGKTRYSTMLSRVSILAIVARRVVIAIDYQTLDFALLISIPLALSSIFIPRLKFKK